MSKTTERRRHESLARETASWRSWAVGSWFTNGHMAMMLDEPFTGPAMDLEYECSCDDDGRRDHAQDLTRPCVFVDVYEPYPSMVESLGETLKRAMQHRGNRLVTIEHEAFPHPHDDVAALCRARVTGETAERAWVALQKPYVDAIERHCRPDRWAWFQMSAPGEPVKAPIIWALRGERNQGVGLIMPVSFTGSAIQIDSPSPEYTGVTA